MCVYGVRKMGDNLIKFVKQFHYNLETQKKMFVVKSSQITNKNDHPERTFSYGRLIVHGSI